MPNGAYGTQTQRMKGKVAISWKKLSRLRKLPVLLAVCMLLACLPAFAAAEADAAVSVWKTEEIDIRDSYVLTYDGQYYLFGTTGLEAFNGSASGFRAFVGDDLENWTGPYTVFANDGTSWATQRYWAPEVYEIDGTFYMFAGWSHPSVEQHLCVLTADNPLGPYTILNSCLAPGNDPTLYEEDGTYYLIYNNPDGMGTGHYVPGMYYVELTDDLSRTVGAPVHVFGHDDEGLDLAMGGNMPEGWETYVTPTGRLIIMWSGHELVGGYYASSLAYFDDGLKGGYTFSNEFFTPFNMGHNNFFYSVDGQLMMTTHYPNDYDNEQGFAYPLFFKVNYDAEKDTLVLDTEEFFEEYGEEYNQKFGKIITATTPVLKNEDINLRDPYILVHNGLYYMYGTRAKDCFTAPMYGFDCYVGTDLENWSEPVEIYHKTDDNPADWAYYAPECYEIDGKYYFFCSWREEGGDEYENILASDSPLGPFEPYAENIAWGIDATLVSEDGTYYMINRSGMETGSPGPAGCYITELADDLSGAVSERQLLFTTEGAAWINPTGFNGEANTTTDGPCPYRMSDGTLLVLWSTTDINGVYNVGIARSDDGTFFGNWSHDAEAAFPGNQGHNMIFTSLEGELMTAMHYPNELGEEHPYFLHLEEDLENHTLRVAG